MDFNRKSIGEMTPVKDSRLSRSKSDTISRNSENFHPNMRSPSLKSSNSPSLLIKSATKSQKSAQKKRSPIRNLVAPPQFVGKIRERKFVIAKKNSKTAKPNSSCNCDSNGGGKSRKCLCVASESLRRSQEEFFKKHHGRDDEFDKELMKCDLSDQVTEQREELAKHGVENPDAHKEAPNGDDSNFKRTRDNLLEESRGSLPETGSGRVMHLVKAFENILTLPKSKDCEEKDNDVEREEAKQGVKWALLGLQSSSNLDSQVSSDSFCPSDFFLTSENLGLSCSFDSSQGSISRRNSDGGRRSRRNSPESSGTYATIYWKRKHLRATSQKPFKLRTEQRGRDKEEEFIKKVQQMTEEEEKLRIHVAQGLPWTTDEPECLVKPPVKEITRPVDLMLHSDIRAEERAEFDHQVAEKMSLIEQYKMERERHQKLAEEEEIRRLRKELVPKAQPMPYFDRPFIPRRAMKHPTIPKEPSFHIPQHKKIKSCMSWSDLTYGELQ